MSKKWNQEIIIEELLKIINKIGHFPTSPELRLINKKGLTNAIYKYGGSNKFRQLMGYKLLLKTNGYWTEEVITKELKEIIKKIGHFPSANEIRTIKISGLLGAIRSNGGLTKYCLLFNYDLSRTPRKYWTDKKIIEELKIIINKICHFPSIYEFSIINRYDLFRAIRFHGGINKFRELLGYDVTSQLSYINKRGRNTEKILKQILIEYCKQHNLSEPSYNKKLCEGNVLEFVCNTNKTIGIDVTNTKSKSCVINKWSIRNYHKHLDELWIVVFSNIFIEEDYNKFNNSSPNNVKIFSIYSFLKELDYSLDKHTKSKVDKYNSCYFHTKEQLVNK